MTFYGRMTGALVAAAIVGMGAAYTASQAAEVISYAQELSDSTACYVIREYEGRVALFREDGESVPCGGSLPCDESESCSEPIAVYSTPITQINAADAELLREGIRIRGLAEAARLLEDLDIE